MKKIMFNDRYGLTQAVLEGKKTMTRRIVSEGILRMARLEVNVHGGDIAERIKDHTPLCYLDEVAIAQSYEAIGLTFISPPDTQWGCTYEIPGWKNKMFVKGRYMPHRIRITDIKVERLQDISEEDCLKEGIQEYFPYIDRNPNDRVRTFQYFRDGKIRYRMSPAPECFARLIDDISGRGTWQRNPWVYAYEFELIK